MLEYWIHWRQLEDASAQGITWKLNTYVMGTREDSDRTVGLLIRL